MAEMGLMCVEREGRSRYNGIDGGSSGRSNPTTLGVVSIMGVRKLKLENGKLCVA